MGLRGGCGAGGDAGRCRGLAAGNVGRGAGGALCRPLVSARVVVASPRGPVTRVDTTCLNSLFSLFRFICIYPAYLNNKKTIAEGRRIPIDKAVENPTSTEIQDVCAAVGFNVLLEKNKMYPREWNRDVQYRGRVRIQLKQDDGNPCLPQFPTRKSVMLYAAETIPKLKTRTQKMGGSDQSLQQGEGGKKGKGKKKK
ncbi:PREDICTED: signal recognition particle 19 kDa protein [Chaetura pelagica]|uniref:signal recognition particle 19 kDa protein n=1 Tax=Chaetura pelagica TaxID=8897 RepID=UPI000523ED85|nr:PREDICTED: signal recognition particle 19 kDa protein [Chaetura pelagica]